jgi:hypothetical protein
MMTKSALVTLLFLAAANLQARPLSGSAKLPADGEFAYAIDLGGFLPGDDWTIEAKVTGLLPNGFQFTSSFFEASDVLHQDLSGKSGTFLLRLPGGERLKVSPGDELSLVISVGRGRCGEPGLALMHDSLLILGNHRRMGAVAEWIHLLPSDEEPNVTLHIQSSTENEAEATTSPNGTAYHLPVSVKTTPENDSASFAVTDLQKQSRTVTAGGRHYGVFVVESSRIDRGQGIGSPSLCPATFALETVTWLK